jgi:hypothetical protein
MQRAHFSWFFAFGVLSVSCAQSHTAVVRSQALPPPPDPIVRHAAPLWLDLGSHIRPSQCVAPRSTRSLCFAEVDQATSDALTRSLWPSFPSVKVLGYSDTPEPGDYVLRIDLALDAVPPSSAGPGWAALAKGQFQLLRDGKSISAELVESRSRADFPYGRALGNGAGEVIDAIALHIAMTLAAIPEPRPSVPHPLPPVQSRPTTQQTAAN